MDATQTNKRHKAVRGIINSTSCTKQIHVCILQNKFLTFSKTKYMYLIQNKPQNGNVFCPTGRRDQNKSWKQKILFWTAPLVLYQFFFPINLDWWSAGSPHDLNALQTLHCRISMWTHTPPQESQLVWCITSRLFDTLLFALRQYESLLILDQSVHWLSLIHIWRCRRRR